MSEYHNEANKLFSFTQKILKQLLNDGGAQNRLLQRAMIENKCRKLSREHLHNTEYIKDKRLHKVPLESLKEELTDYDDMYGYEKWVQIPPTTNYSNEINVDTLNELVDNYLENITPKQPLISTTQLRLPTSNETKNVRFNSNPKSTVIIGPPIQIKKESSTIEPIADMNASGKKIHISRYNTRMKAEQPEEEVGKVNVSNDNITETQKGTPIDSTKNTETLANSKLAECNNNEIKEEEGKMIEIINTSTDESKDTTENDKTVEIINFPTDANKDIEDSNLKSIFDNKVIGSTTRAVKPTDNSIVELESTEIISVNSNSGNPIHKLNGTTHNILEEINETGTKNASESINIAKHDITTSFGNEMTKHQGVKDVSPTENDTAARKTDNKNIEPLEISTNISDRKRSMSKKESPNRKKSKSKNNKEELIKSVESSRATLETLLGPASLNSNGNTFETFHKFRPPSPTEFHLTPTVINLDDPKIHSAEKTQASPISELKSMNPLKKPLYPSPTVMQENMLSIPSDKPILNESMNKLMSNNNRIKTNPFIFKRDESLKGEQVTPCTNYPTASTQRISPNPMLLKNPFTSSSPIKKPDNPAPVKLSPLPKKKIPKALKKMSDIVSKYNLGDS